MARVRSGVLTKQGTDISEMLNETAGERATDLLGVLIAESSLDEIADRVRAWPDVSSGLSQVIAANLGYGTLRPPVPATPEELAEYQAYMHDPANAIKEGWRFYNPALTRMGGDALWAALSYNRGPSYTREQLQQQVDTDPGVARKLERYRASLAQAEGYAVTDTDIDCEAEISQLQQQIALLTQINRLILEGKWTGAEGAAGLLVALEGGQTSIDVLDLPKELAP